MGNHCFEFEIRTNQTGSGLGPDPFLNKSSGDLESYCVSPYIFSDKNPKNN